MIKCFGTTTRLWLLDMFNDCLKQQQLPNVWRKAKVVALLKPGKYPESPKSYKTIALLCSFYKLLDRMILTRLQCKIEHKRIPQQAGFRLGKSCCSQVLNLTQHIEDGFELGQITGAPFIDLTAAYDTINHRRFLAKLVMLTDDVPLTMFIRTMLPNRRFKVELMANRVDGETSEMAFHKAQCYALCCSTCTPTTSHFQLPPTVSFTPTTCALPPNIICSNRWRIPSTAD